MKLKDLIALAGEDAEIVFDDDNAEFTYGVEVLNTARDHVTLTFDLGQRYMRTYSGKKLKEAN